MNKNRILLPWYINHSLTEAETSSVEFWLQNNPDAGAYQNSIQRIAGAIHCQNEVKPSLQVRAKVLSEISQIAQQTQNIWQWLWGIPLATLIFALLWLVIQPGNQLQWSVQGADAAVFRIYRAPVGDSNFKLVNELAANPIQQDYQFADPVILLGQNYNYAIEIIDQFGNTSISQVATSNSMTLLVAQFAILLTSFMLTFGMITIAQELKSFQLSYFVD